MELIGNSDLNDQFRPMKIAPAHLFDTETRFCKLSFVSVFFNWLYSSERKHENAKKN